MTAAECPVGGNTLREDIARALWEYHYGTDTPLQMTGSGRDRSIALADAVLAVVAPHLDAAETALGKVRALADEWESRADAADRGAYTKRERWVRPLRARAQELRAALASAEATADTQETP